MKSETSNAKQSSGTRRKTLVKALLVVAGAAVLAGVAISCATTRTVMAPPDIPGAQFLGSESCKECHADIAKRFNTSTHARLQAKGDTAANVGCESCHGPGSLHKESGGAYHTIINPRKSPETCFRCHLDKRAEFSLPYAHPVLDGPNGRPVSAGGKVSCADCHDPHQGPAVVGGSTSLSTEFDTCGRCHTAQRGPFVFEHEALREGCTTCHKPHGSVNPRMLVDRNANLCLKCHFQQQTAGGVIFIGGGEHSSRLSRGTCWSAGCHEAVHGSQTGSSLRF